MEHSFSLLRKQSIVLYRVSMLFLASFYLVVGIWGMIDCFKGSLGIADVVEKGYLSTIIVTSVSILIGLVSLFTACYLIIAKPYSRRVYFTPAGVRFKHKDIFLSWDDVKHISINIIGFKSFFVISTTPNKPNFIKRQSIKATPEKITIECRKELVPVIEKYWDNPIKKIDYYRTKNNNAYLIITVLLFSIIIILLIILFAILAGI